MAVKKKRKSLPKKPKGDAIESSWYAATITSAELAESRYQLRYDQMQMVARAVSETYIALEFNAKQLAAVPLKLVKRATARGRQGPEKTKRLSLSQKAWGRRHINGKAAEYANEADDFVEVVDHPAKALLGNPNSPETAVEFMRAHWISIQAAGCMYWLHNATRASDPDSIERLFPQWTKIDLDENGVKSYSYGRERSRVVTFPWEQVIPFKWMPSLANPWYGEGWIKAIAPECDSLVAAIQTSLNRWNNEGLPPFVAKLPQGSGKDQIDQVKEQMRRLSGPRSAGVPFVGGTELVLSPLQWPNKDIQYLEEKKDLRETIWRAAGIPAQMMQMQSGGLSSGGEAQNSAKGQYIEYTIMPALSALCDRLTESYNPLFGLTPGEYWWMPDNPMSEDQQGAYESSRKDAEAGILTINESRALRNYEPVEGGDVPRIKGIPLDTAEKAAEAAANPQNQQEPAKPGDKPEDKPQEKPPEKPAEKAIPARPKSLFVRHLLAGSGKMACPCGCQTKDATDVEGSPLDVVADQEAALTEQMSAYYRTVEWDYADGKVEYDRKKERERLVAVLLLFLVTIYEDGYQDGATRLPASSASVPPMSVEAATTWARAEATRAATSITQTIQDTLRATATNGENAGLSPDEIKAELAAKMDDLAKVGPARVSSTETVNAFNEGATGAAKAASEANPELAIKKQWKTADDEMVCPFCREMNGRTVGLDEPFHKAGSQMTADADPGWALRLIFDYGDVNTAPLHPNCRCWVVFVLEGDNGE